ncbi:TPA: hypothetical protein ACGCHS_004189 [Stenotrophomonas maltophilia]
MFRNGPFPWFLPAIGIYAIAPGAPSLVLVVAAFLYFLMRCRYED